MTGEHVTAYLIALATAYYLVRFAVWVIWPREAPKEIER